MSTSPKCCVYDNPSTCRREAWSDGELVACVSESQLETAGFNGHRSFAFMLNTGYRFTPGRITGDKAALQK